MENKTLQTQNPINSNVYEELKDLASLLSDVINNIKVSEKPIVESRDTVPKAAEQLEKITKQTEDAAHQLLDATDSISNRESDISAQLKELRKVLPATYFRNNSRVKRVYDAIKENITANQDDIFTMMNVLQFQDITAQQTAHAISLLDQVEHRLQHVLQKYDGKTPKQNEIQSHDGAYNPDAEFNTNHSSQEEADKLFEK